ncbi:MAG: hypothetical protein ACOX0H_00610 [Patescibacteria group bacterium]|jgi:hypothetical protein|nr:hypothetical protein [bacterium]HQC49794.1 hypothetical protein [bacterium]
MKQIQQTILKMRKIGKLANNLVFFISFLMIFSALIYYVYALNWLGIFLSVFLAIISLIFLNKYFPNSVQKEASENNEIKNWQFKRANFLLFLAWGIFLGAALVELLIARSARPLITPWEVVSPRFFFFFILSSGLLWFIILKNSFTKKFKLSLISVHYFLILIVAVIVYKIGYGFDPFIHEATINLIVQNGVVTPKTPYYLGQYGFIVILNKCLGLSIALLNKLLVTLLAAMLLPGAIYKLSKKLFFETKINSGAPWLSTIIILSFLTPLFIITTPQNLSYIFIILALLSGLNKEANIKTLIFALTAAAIHPLAGIPALIWSMWLIVKKYTTNKRLNNYLLNILTITLSIFLTPLALFFASGKKISNFQLNFEAIITPLLNVFKLNSAGREDWLLNLTYLLQKNYSILILVLIISGLVIFFKNKKQIALAKNIQGALMIASSLFFGFILSSQIAFSELIIYEQGSYAKRILIIILLFLGPFILLLLNKIFQQILNDKRFLVKITWFIIGISFLGINLYLSYPRFDKYFNSRGYSTSIFDLEAVKTIENQKTNENYVVLANQQVSAAALKIFGFNNYYDSALGPIYFYPIPTGGPLYQYYLQMVYNQPERETAYQAMELTKTNELYLVINKYWYESDKIIKAAKVTADSWSKIADQEIYIFKYLK